ncbi:beta-propeller fold lactonase family protein [Rubripirellula sp.]|nr:beta-propeller fold lactonase family protein [Rubripirellula sp.]
MSRHPVKTVIATAMLAIAGLAGLTLWRGVSGNIRSLNASETLVQGRRNAVAEQQQRDAKSATGTERGLLTENVQYGADRPPEANKQRTTRTPNSHAPQKNSNIVLISNKAGDRALDRSPVDLALSPDGRWLVTANQIANSVSLIDTDSGEVVGETPCGEYPVDIAFTPDGSQILLTAQWQGTLQSFEIADGKLVHRGDLDIGFDPAGIAITSDGKRAYVGQVADAKVAVVDLQKFSLIRRIESGQWPRYLTLSPDGQRLAVGNGGDSDVSVIDTASGETLYEEPLANGTNLGQMRTSADGKYAYFTWMVYRTNPITTGNIRRGWVLGSRIGRVRLDGASYREAITLDVPGRAVADPHDLVISDDQEWLVASASGTHELLIYKLSEMPFIAQGGPGDLIDRKLQYNRDLFDRMSLGGRPMGLRMAKDNRTLYVANYLLNAVQVVDLQTRTVTSEIALGGPKKKTLARKGMEIFYDGQRSLDQWYSCHSCHQEGGTNARPMDTWNDGTEMSLKTVLPLHDVVHTFPWTWHGWQRNMTEAMEKSITSTMQGEAPTTEDKQALIAYLSTLKSPPNPFRQADGSLNAAARRGKQVFFSPKAGCADCHNGPRFTDGQIHDVGLGSDKDAYKGYNTPSLVGVYRKVRLLHSGRARDLERVVSDLHSPGRVNGEGELSEEQTADLIEYLKSL